MNEWDQGLAKWHSNKVRSKFRKKYGRSVGSRSGVRKSNLKGKKQKIVLSYSDRKIDAEWAKGVYSRNFQIQINRALRRFKQIKSFDAELSGSEWNDDFENWENLRLFSKSWKWIKPKKLNRAGNFLKRKITRRIKKNVDLSHFQKVHDKIYCVPSYESVEKSLIYVYRHGVQFGPYTKKRLQSLIDIGKFEYSDLGFAKRNIGYLCHVLKDYFSE